MSATDSTCDVPAVEGEPELRQDGQTCCPARPSAVHVSPSLPPIVADDGRLSPPAAARDHVYSPLTGRDLMSRLDGHGKEEAHPADTEEEAHRADGEEEAHRADGEEEAHRGGASVGGWRRRPRGVARKAARP